MNLEWEKWEAPRGISVLLMLLWDPKSFSQFQQVSWNNTHGKMVVTRKKN